VKRILPITGLVAIVLSLALPATALAAKAETVAPFAVQFVLRGRITSYTAATISGPGSVSIKVRSSNYERALLKGTTLTFSTDMKTKVVLHDGKPIMTGDKGVVKVRAQKTSSMTTLELAVAKQVIDQGRATPRDSS